MADVNKRFITTKRRAVEFRPVCERLKDYQPVCLSRNDECSEEQASRCMDCGTPFCHWGCPIGNYISEWNVRTFEGLWPSAYQLLDATNPLPEITGRICPAPCEYSCVLGITDEPVTIRENELAIIEHAFKEGEVRPNPPKVRTGKRVAIVGSGPAGLACAARLNKAGHNVVVFERDKKIGGILRYGIPDFKLEKWVIERRLEIYKKEGLEFVTGTDVGADISVERLKREFDAVLLAGGCRVPRDLNIEGRGLRGIHFAMDYLIGANRKVAGEGAAAGEFINAYGKRVLVIGGGDTGADCVGTAHRQGASCVIQVEVLPRPPECRSEDMPWPKYPMLLKTSSSHEEGGERHWAVKTQKFIGERGHLKRVSCVRVEFSDKDEKGCPIMKESPGGAFELEAEMVILAVGFVHPEHKGLLEELEIEFDPAGNVKTDANFRTFQKGIISSKRGTVPVSSRVCKGDCPPTIFSAGDMRRGQSLIVHALSEGRRAARAIDEFLMGESRLPTM